MRGVSRFSFSALTLLAGSLTLAACGGGSSATGPSEAPVPVAAGQAVLQGAIDGAASRSSGDLRAAATPHAGMRVTVVGTGITAVVDSDGQFVLAGLPAGAVTLRFEGDGVDCQLEVTGLVDGLVLTVTLAVEGSQVRVLSAPPPKPSCEFKFDGVVESVAGTRLVVAGRQVDASDTKKVWRGDYRIGVGDLKVGDRVSVAGQLLGSGVIAAYEISADGPKMEGKPYAFKGKVDSVSPFKVSGIKVRTDGGTVWKWSDGTGLDPAQVLPGDQAYVEGTKYEDGTVQAGKVVVDCR